MKVIGNNKMLIPSENKEVEKQRDDEKRKLIAAKTTDSLCDQKHGSKGSGR